MGDTAIVSIDGAAGRLSFRGHPIEDLAERSFEAVSLLILDGELPSPDQEEAWRREIASWRTLPASATAALGAAGGGGDLLHEFRTGVAAAAAEDPAGGRLDRGTERRRVARILAWTAGIAALAVRREAGKPLPGPDPDLGYAAHFLYQATGEVPPEPELRAFEASLVVQAEHGIHAAALAALTVSAAGCPLDLAVLAGIGALSGSLHGGANRPAYRMVIEAGSPDAARAWAAERIAERFRFPGYGHRVYKSPDPRARILAPHAKALLGSRGKPEVYDTFEAMRDEIESALGAKGILANVDAVTGLIYAPLGLPLSAFTIPFCLAIQVGWMAHALEYHGGAVIEPGALTVREADPR